MRFKFFVFVGLFLTLFSSVFAFEVYDSQGDIEVFFSLNTDDIKVESTSNLSNVRIDYMVLGTNFSKTFEFESCADKFCVYTTLGNLILDEEGGILSNLEQFNISVATQKKTVYLDIEKPVFDYIDYNINSKNYGIEFNYSYSDNSNNIKKVELYKKFGEDLKFVTDLINKNSYVFDIEESNNFIFNFRIYDEAGNLRLVEKVISVGDIFAPKIEDIFVELKNSNYLLTFNLSDNNLSKYEISQAGLLLSEDIGGKSYLKTINLPFSDGSVLFKVIDGNGNSVNTTLSLKSSISNKYESIYSNNKEFKFSSNAQACYLTKVDSKSYSNEEFTKSSSTFSKSLSISKVQEYNVDFYCEKDNFREYYSRAFYYDINKPTNTQISLSANDVGGVDISWNESKDDESEVGYKLFRDDDLIYGGKKESFEDNNAKYPNSYTYYVEVYDEALNSVESSEVSIIPKKVLVTFLSDLVNTKVDFSNYNFEINTDKNSNVKIVVKNSGVVIKEENFANITSSKLNLNYDLKNGENVISVLIVDELGNRLTKEFSVVYREPILVQEKPEVPVVIEPVIEQINITPVVEAVSENNSQEGFFSWFWFFVILIVFGIFIKYFIIDENKLSFIKNGNSKRSSKTIHSLYSHKGAKDSILEKDFNRIKKERIKKQQERDNEVKMAKLSLEKVKSRSQFSQAKMDDLASRKKVFIPFTKRVEQKVATAKIRKEKEYDMAVLAEKRDKPTWFKKKESNIVQDDEFSRYLQKVKDAPSWGTSRDYVHKEPIPEPKPNEVNPDEYVKSLDSKKSMQEDKLEKAQDKRIFSIFRRSRPVSIDDAKSPSQVAQVSQKEGVESVVSDSSKKVERVKIDLDDYLNKRTKNKRRNLFFAEKSVENDLMDREN